jgi:hypothetical protein
MQIEIEKSSDNTICIVNIPIEDQQPTQEMILNMVYNCGKNDSVSLRDIIHLDGKKFKITAIGFKEVV